VRDSLLTLPQFNPVSFSFFSHAFSGGLLLFSFIFPSLCLVQGAKRKKEKKLQGKPLIKKEHLITTSCQGVF
jgi:hypothetical protein